MKKQPTRGARPSALLAGLLAASTLAAGCSIALVTSRRASPPSEGVRGCTTEYTAPILDSLLFVPSVAVAGLGLAGGADVPRSFGIGVGLVGAVVFAASAVYGYGAVSDCRDAYARTGKPLPD
ncbi:MAG TPA: hypothetical protein VGP64_04195 [Polyangia bacterium]